MVAPKSGMRQYCRGPLAIPAFAVCRLAAAYFYGRRKQRRGWILIGVWLPLQLTLSFTNNFVVSCPQLDMPIDAPRSRSDIE